MLCDIQGLLCVSLLCFSCINSCHPRSYRIGTVPILQKEKLGHGGVVRAPEVTPMEVAEQALNPGSLALESGSVFCY